MDAFIVISKDGPFVQRLFKVCLLLCRFHGRHEPCTESCSSYSRGVPSIRIYFKPWKQFYYMLL